MRPRDFWQAVYEMADNPEPGVTVVLSNGMTVKGYARIKEHDCRISRSTIQIDIFGGVGDPQYVDVRSIVFLQRNTGA